MVTDTICQVGCLMSSVSMALLGNGILVGGQQSNPGVLNQWLRTNGGYDGGNDLEEDVLPNINRTAVFWPADGMHKANDLAYVEIESYLVRGRVVVANVMQGHHFVLVTGWNYKDGDSILVNDPGFDNTTYSYSRDVVGWRIFDLFGKEVVP